MLDAICMLSKNHKPTQHQIGEVDTKAQTIFSIYEFKLLPNEKIEQYRHSLFCPECLQVAYFRRASKDGKQACFGSRYHLENCSELNTYQRNKKAFNLSDDSQFSDVNDETVIIDSPKVSAVSITPSTQAENKLRPNQDQGFTINFSAKPIVSGQRTIHSEKVTTASSGKKINVEEQYSERIESEPVEKKVTQTLAALLKSLFKNSSLATSEVWVHTSEKHRWRAKNLFVHFSNAQQLEKIAPRMYWGTISHTDKKLLWLNVTDNKQLSIPIRPFKEALLARYKINQADDLKGARMIVFAKCLNNKQQNRQFLTLWDNDLQYLHLTLVTPSTAL